MINTAQFLLDEHPRNEEEEGDAAEGSPRYDTELVNCYNMLNLCSSVHTMGSGMKMMMENMLSSTTLGE